MSGPETPHYGSGPVPPGAFAPRPQTPGPPRKEDLAEWWRRAVALLIDAVIIGVVTAIVLGLLGAGLVAGGDDNDGVGALVVAFIVTTLVFTVLALLYAPILMARTNGQTLGKMATGCRVVRADGRRVSFGWAAVREALVKGLLLGVASSLTGGIAYVVDGIWPFIDGENRALHDYVVDSRVVKA